VENQPIIQVKHLSKKFGSFEAVKDVSFTVNKGDVFGFLGPNGVYFR
jgi:ABC-2 type transport system ATP-binding protein